MHSDRASELLRAEDRSSDLLALGVALAKQQPGEIARTAISLFVSVLVGEPFTAAVVKLGLELAFGKWFSELDAPAVTKLSEASGKEVLANTLGPYFAGGVETARRVTEKPGPDPKQRMIVLLRVWNSNREENQETTKASAEVVHQPAQAAQSAEPQPTAAPASATRLQPRATPSTEAARACRKAAAVTMGRGAMPTGFAKQLNASRERSAILWERATGDSVKIRALLQQIAGQNEPTFDLSREMDAVPRRDAGAVGQRSQYKAKVEQPRQHSPQQEPEQEPEREPQH